MLREIEKLRREQWPAFEKTTFTRARSLTATYPLVVRPGRLDELRKRRDAARKAGRKYGIGFAVVVEPAMSNMGYLSTILTPETREKAGPKNGASSLVTVNIDPLGAVSVTADATELVAQPWRSTSSARKTPIP